MRVEGVRDVQVIGDEGAQPVFAGVREGVGARSADGDVCAAMKGVLVVVGYICRELGGRCGCNVRAEESSFAGDDGDDDVGHFGDFVEELGDAEVAGHAHRVELLLRIEGDDGDFAALFEEDCGLRVEVGHGGWSTGVKSSCSSVRV